VVFGFGQVTPVLSRLGEVTMLNIMASFGAGRRRRTQLESRSTTLASKLCRLDDGKEALMGLVVQQGLRSRSTTSTTSSTSPRSSACAPCPPSSSSRAARGAARSSARTGCTELRHREGYSVELFCDALLGIVAR